MHPTQNQKKKLSSNKKNIFSAPPFENFGLAHVKEVPSGRVSSSHTLPFPTPPTPGTTSSPLAPFLPAAAASFLRTSSSPLQSQPLLLLVLLVGASPGTRNRLAISPSLSLSLSIRRPVPSTPHQVRTPLLRPSYASGHCPLLWPQSSFPNWNDRQVIDP